MPAEHADALRGAWDEMIDRLGRAREALESPELHAPPEAGPRDLAEGYRYLLGFVHSAAERAFFGDPAFPYFRRSLQVLDKATIDNADALYLSTPVDGRYPYRITGRVRDSGHWRGQRRAPAGLTAPQYLIIEAHTGYAGDSGDLAELRPGVRGNTGTLDSSELVVGEDGRFEILMAPERPAGHTGNFIGTQRNSRRTGRTFYAEHVTVRALFHDWEREESPELLIHRLDQVGEHPPALEPATVVAALRRVGEIVDNQTRFWNKFYDVVLEAHGDRNGDGVSFMPRNDFNTPAAASLAAGGGQSTNIYSGGVYELGEDEALLVDTEVFAPPAYMGFHLANVWGESHDYANHVSSLNGAQAERDDDGHYRYVVAHRDPGVPNWLDTTGLRVGFMAIRWTYPRPTDRLPTVSARKIPFGGLDDHLPASTRRVSPEERREQVRVRQQHVQRRYRQY
ncbi:hypothetical protein MSAS_51820 [Mycobacterium saskatchewanense]|uniref:DUF1214 domain-containing protein n=1 Tax=Mycobacterium saskatchewanense TaxID=220927 RepID=A0AAJ3NRP3_9MYCO|nr:hypothetical protein [Mycobacterium saskatchewanense]ORW72641.1 hypothetical protein AWC23_09315 [Mycobacterium saskatchewanense]BBX66008.1 hypothetical protein MSAS_51820 [Mycobacterium saskatchewanense]